MLLGDKIYYVNGFTPIFKEAAQNAKNVKDPIFGYYVYDPERFGIVEFDDDGRVLQLKKLKIPKSNY